MKSQDIFILLKLISMRKASSNQVGEKENDAGSLSARNLALLTGVGKTEVNASINRSLDVGLAKRSRKDNALSVNNKSLLEFIVYGIKYVFPARPAELVRGMPTAHGAPVLARQLMSGSDSVLVQLRERGFGESIKDIRVIDVHDTGHPMLVSMWRKRMRGYRALGWREITKEQLF